MSPTSRLVAPTLACALVCGVAHAETSLEWPAEVAWRSVFVGVDVADVVIVSPRPVRLHAARVDLQADGVRLTTDDDNGDRDEEVDGYRTSTFLLRKGCQLAVNGAPFWPGQADEGLPQNIVGLVVSDGRLVSPWEEDKPREALVVRGARAAIEQPPVDLAGVTIAVGGYGVVLQAGRLVRDDTEEPALLDSLHPRTAVGVGEGGRTLVLLVADGRQPGYSEGVTLGELGDALRRVGASDGLNLDGGGTSTMAISDGAGGVRLVNRPIEGKTPGAERVSASHLGVYADRLASPPSP